MKSFRSFIPGLIIPLVFYVLGGLVLFHFTYSFSSQTLNEYEHKIALIFYGVLAVFILTALLVFKLFKLKNRYFSMGIALSTLPVIAMLVKIGFIYFGQFNDQQPFNKNLWIAHDEKAFSMAETLSTQKKLIGLNRKKVIDKPGYFK